VRLISRDSFAERVLLGEHITVSQVLLYASRSAFNDARGSGTEPVCRELYYARTETERKNGIRLNVGESTGLGEQIVYAHGDNDTWHTPVVEVVDTYHLPQACVEAKLTLSRVFAVFEEIGRGDDMVLIRLKAEGHSYEEIAGIQGLSSSEVRKRISAARKAFLEYADEFR